MGARGRKSEASLAIAKVERHPRIQPPRGMPAEAAGEFRRITGSLPALHFVPSDAPLLARYCEVIAMANHAEDTAEFCQLVRLQMALAVKLRLAPSTRGHHRTTAREKVGGGRHWESEIDG